MPRTIVNDGARQWQVYDDHVMTGPASPPTSDVADLVDASWLLDRDLDLSGGTEAWAGGRRAYRVVARYRDVTGLGMGWWQRLFFPAVAVVDAENGLVLRLTRFKGGRPTLRQELRDVAPLEPGAGFAFTPPDGMPVHDSNHRRTIAGRGPGTGPGIGRVKPRQRRGRCPPGPSPPSPSARSGTRASGRGCSGPTGRRPTGRPPGRLPGP